MNQQARLARTNGKRVSGWHPFWLRAKLTELRSKVPQSPRAVVGFLRKNDPRTKGTLEPDPLVQARRYSKFGKPTKTDTKAHRSDQKLIEAMNFFSNPKANVQSYVLYCRHSAVVVVDIGGGSIMWIDIAAPRFLRSELLRAISAS